MDSLLWPLKVAVAYIMVYIHKALVLVGLPDGAGIAWVLSIVGLTVVVRILIMPLFVKQIRASRNITAPARISPQAGGSSIKKPGSGTVPPMRTDRNNNTMGARKTRTNRGGRGPPRRPCPARRQTTDRTSVV